VRLQFAFRAGQAQYSTGFQVSSSLKVETLTIRGESLAKSILNRPLGPRVQVGSVALHADHRSFSDETRGARNIRR
jgi:hypothetical protein